MGVQNFVAGDGPVSVTVNPVGTFAYVTNEGSNHVSRFGIHPRAAAGALTPGTAAVLSSNRRHYRHHPVIVVVNTW